MEKFINGIKFTLGVFLICGIVLGLVFATGWHTPNEILSGTFIGNYSFIGDLDLSDTNLIGFPNRVGDYALLEVNNGTDININHKYILENPFGNDTPVIVLVEIYVDGLWADPGFTYSSESGGYGVKANYVEGVGIVVQTGGSYLNSLPYLSGGVFNVYSTTAPARVHVWKIS